MAALASRSEVSMVGVSHLKTAPGVPVISTTHWHEVLNVSRSKPKTPIESYVLKSGKVTRAELRPDCVPFITKKPDKYITVLRLFFDDGSRALLAVRKQDRAIAKRLIGDIEAEINKPVKAEDEAEPHKKGFCTVTLHGWDIKFAPGNVHTLNKHQPRHIVNTLPGSRMIVNPGKGIKLRVEEYHEIPDVLRLPSESEAVPAPARTPQLIQKTFADFFQPEMEQPVLAPPQ